MESMTRIGALAFAALVLTGCAAAAPGATDRPAARPLALAATGPGAQPALSLSLNVPACRLDVREGGKVVRSYPVSVGTPDHPTPLGSFAIDRVEWNPWWVPPPFDWARDERVTPPGPTNPVGRVRLTFARYLHIHGTSLEETLGTAASHGCVRMSNEDAIELARRVHAAVPPALPDSLLAALEADPGRTLAVRLEETVPISIDYARVEVRQGRLEIHPDPYRRAGVSAADVLHALAVAGVPPDAIDRAAVDAVVARAAGGAVSVPVVTFTRAGS